MISKFIIYNPKTNLFDFFITSLIYELKNYNIETIIYNNNINININYNKDIIFIIINPHFIYDYQDIYNDLTKFKKMFKYKILYITEPINFLIEKKVYNDIIKLINPFCLWTYTTENFNKLNIFQKNFKIFPLNKELYFTDIDINNLKKRQTNKIVFIGNINENRIESCNYFSKNNLLINYTNKWSKEEWIEILNNNLFYLNIHRRVGCKSFEAFRIIPILANGGIIISEELNEQEQKLYEPYNIIFVNKKDLLKTFLTINNNINNNYYEDIYNKTLKFRNEAYNFNDLNIFLEYFNKL